MLYAGSDDGVYRVDGIDEAGASRTTKVLDSGRVMRVRSFDGVEGLFAATASGLYHAADGEDWSRLDVPRESVYAVGASPDGSRLYAGTRPAHVYAASLEDGRVPDDPEWNEREAFQELPSREEWHTPRHENLAHVRSLETHPDRPDRVVAGVEVGGVHLSDDHGRTWTERRTGTHDDVHELFVVGPEEFLTATGFGLFRTADAGRSWTRLDEHVDQRYFRSVFARDGTIYAGGGPSASPNWDDDPEHVLLVGPPDDLQPVETPRPDELAIGWTVTDGDVLAGTHRGTLLREADSTWRVAGTVPTPGQLRGRYLPLEWVEA
ncbi:MAG: WD40/YVTN/BNR-like repeat-containing protein [Halanaeroarchaeum sp.]